MKVQILPLGYVGHVVEQGLIFHTVRLSSGTLIIAPIGFIETME